MLGKKVELLTIFLIFVSLLIILIGRPTVAHAEGSLISFRSATFANNGTGSTSLTISKPGGVSFNDVMVAQILFKGGQFPLISAPDGWNFIRRDNTTVLISDSLYYKVATSAEPGNYTWTINSSNQAAGGIVAYSGVDTSSPIDAQSGSVNLNAGTPITALSVNTSTSSDMLLFFGGVTSKTSINPPAGMTQRWFVNGNSSLSSEVAEQIFTSAGMTGNRIGTSGSTSASNIGQLIALKPADLPATSSPTPTAEPTPTLVLFPTPTLIPDPTPTPGVDSVLVGAGDVCVLASIQNAYNTANLILGIPGVRVLALGDLAYDSGSQANYDNCLAKTWGQFKDRTSPVLGNHDYGTKGAVPYFNYYGAAAGDPTKGYYSFDEGSWHVIALNSECSKVSCASGSQQEQWLRSDLAAHPTQCTLAYWHRQYFTSGSTGPNSAAKPLVQALYDYNADLILGGHNHYYERFLAQDPNYNYDPTRGIVSITVGTGGGVLTGVGSTTFKNNVIRNGKNFGVLKLTLHSNSFDWQFLPTLGENFTDTGTESCH